MQFSPHFLCQSAGLSSSPTTLYERYSSPTSNPTRRRLFVDNDPPTEATRTPVRVSQQPVISTMSVQNVSTETIPVTPVPGQTLVTVATATVTANNGQTVTIPVQGKEDAWSLQDVGNNHYGGSQCHRWGEDCSEVGESYNWRVWRYPFSVGTLLGVPPPSEGGAVVSGSPEESILCGTPK